MKTIDLSIIIPIYNVESYLRECLESVYAVNLLKEVILVNDGSTDHSLQIAEEFAEKYPEETILISQENRGLSAARNVGLERARGEYIYFIDSDDFLNSHVFENFFTQIKGTNLDILHGSGMRYENEASTVSITHNGHITVTETAISGREFIYRMFEADTYVDYVWLNIYRRDFLLENSFFFQEGITYEDVLFSMPVFFRAKKIRHLESHFYYYRIRENSITNMGRNYMDFFYIFNFLTDFVLQEKLEHKMITRLIVARIRSLAKKEKVFNRIIYKKLWKLPKKNWNVFRNLIDLYFRGKLVKEISYEEILNRVQKMGRK
ncbi:MAG TPA: glycosyltransferase [Fusobacterium sp.]|uniref:glycosyltransferase n=1 Tax=Fusobacterium sp. TaxID=68766 RepID=UPI002F42C1B1